MRVRWHCILSVLHQIKIMYINPWYWRFLLFFFNRFSITNFCCIIIRQSTKYARWVSICLYLWIHDNVTNNDSVQASGTSDIATKLTFQPGNLLSNWSFSLLTLSLIPSLRDLKKNSLQGKFYTIEISFAYLLLIRFLPKCRLLISMDIFLSA